MSKGTHKSFTWSGNVSIKCKMEDGNNLLESFCHGPAKNPTSYYLYLLWRVWRLVSQHHSVIISYCLRVSSFKDRQDWWWQFRYHLGFPLSHGESWELCHSRWYDSWPDKRARNDSKRVASVHSFRGGKVTRGYDDSMMVLPAAFCVCVCFVCLRVCFWWFREIWTMANATMFDNVCMNPIS